VVDQIVGSSREEPDRVHLRRRRGQHIEDLNDAAISAGRSPPCWPSTSFPRRRIYDGYSRSGGRLGVVAATSGGGALNLVSRHGVN